MKARHEFLTVEDYKDYLVHYYAGQALSNIAEYNNPYLHACYAVKYATDLVEELNIQ